jgi:hypothetical protein
VQNLDLKKKGMKLEEGTSGKGTREVNEGMNRSKNMYENVIMKPIILYN